jgi:hypothetical protein
VKPQIFSTACNGYLTVLEERERESRRVTLTTEEIYISVVFDCLLWDVFGAKHEGITEEENNGYIVFKLNIHGLAGK